MRFVKTLPAVLALTVCVGCGGAARQDQAASRSEMPAGQTAAPNAVKGPVEGGGGGAVQDVSLEQAGDSQAAPVPAERKIIRNANISLEVDDVPKAAQRVATVAEARGGFVVTSESRQQSADDDSKTYDIVTVEVRVPAAQFDAAVGEIRAAGGRVIEEKVTGQDVTEEYIDLEARIRTHRALEAQFLEIMKQARTVADALQVQRELANVRTDIERLEGRRRFLENQTSLSTIKVTLRPPTPFVSAGGFGRGIREAFGDGIDIAATITLGLIRVVIALIPVVVLVFLPLGLLVRYAVRRIRRPQPPAGTEKLP